MRIVLDENLPHPLKQAFGLQHFVTTVQELGLAGVTNGELLARLEGQFDVMITADKNLRHQQRMAGRTLAILELPTNRLPALINMYAAIVAAAEAAQPGQYLTLPVDAGQKGSGNGA